MEYTIWRPKETPRAAIQLLHGMAEHIGRYERLAMALNQAGYLVVGHNHPGHGPKAEYPGYFADEKGWDAVLNAAHEVSLSIKKEYPWLALYLLGHSMGSFAAREYALRWGDELDGLILSGTGFYPKALCTAGRLLASISPRKKPAKLVDGIAFSGNNKPFRPARTGFDWLSRDEEEVDKYIADPCCGFTFTGRAFADFFGGLTALTSEKRLLAIPDRLPVYFLSGDRDPVGQMGKGVKKVAAQFRTAGIHDVTVKLYPDARHELFNETNRDQVTADLIAWLDEKMDASLGDRVLRHARFFANMPWQGEEKNRFHGEDSQGYRVDTPDSDYTNCQYPCAWWKTGEENLGMPYCWGGWSDEKQFLEGLEAGKFAGNVPEERPNVISRDCVGMDCSGLISVCWHLPKKHSTRDLAALCDYVAVSDLQPGDILLKAGNHVLFFDGFAEEGIIRSLEATRYGGRVLQKERSLQELTENGYLAYRLKKEYWKSI
ncbi:MAG: alpha/beta hydrolase [Clostridiales bacterium]|nr:alpha/beta hydrolase [Clostridiales bacterium]